MTPTTSAPSRRYAFTLIEVLVVVTILSILMAVGASIITGNMESMQMIQAIENTRHKMEYARQVAMTQNHRVELRIYRMKNETGTSTWNAFEIGTIETTPTLLPNSIPEEIFQPTSSLSRLPAGYAFHPATAFSSLLSHTGIRTGTQAATDSPDGHARDYASFQFLPDGRCLLDTGEKWTLTIIKENQLVSTSALPANFATLQLDAATARLRLYRP